MEEKVEQAKQQKQQNNLLLLACTRGYTADAQHLVQTGAQVSAHDKQGRSALHFAAAHGQIDIVTYLWSKGAELDWESPDGRTALHVAALGGHGNVVKFLLQKHPWADAQDAHDNTPLHLAARSKSQQALSLLINIKAATGMQNKLGLTPLAEAVVQGKIPNAELLIAKDPGGLQHQPRGWSMLHLAAALGQADSVKLLLRHKANMHDSSNSPGLTPLHAAAMAGSAACVNLLLNAGASTSAVSRDGSLAKDFIPKDHTDSSQLQALLKSSATTAQRHTAAETSSSSKAVSGESPAGRSAPRLTAFRALTQKQQLGRCQRWADSDLNSSALSSELQAFWPEVKQRLSAAHTTTQALSLHKMLMKLHDDEGYQKDVGDPKALDAIILLLQKHPDRFERYTQNPAIKRAFKKIELFQSVVKATGHQGQVPWQETLVHSRGSNWKAEDEQRKKGLELMLQTQLEAAVAAALAGPSGVATAVRSSGKPPRPRQAAEAGGGGGGASTSGSGNVRQRQGSAGQGQSGRAGASGQGSPNDDDPDEYKPLTWREALWQMRFQLAGNLLLVFLFFVYTSWLRYTGGRQPPPPQSQNPADSGLGGNTEL